MLVKGSAFIKNVLERASLVDNNQSGNQSMQSIPTTQTMPSTPAMSIDEAMETQPAVDALSMGLDAGRVRAVLQRRINSTGRPFIRTDDLVNAVFEGQIEDEGGVESSEAERRLENQVTQLLLSAVSSVGLNSDESEQAAAVAAAQSRNESMASTSSAAPEDEADERRFKNVECKICMAEEVGVVFLPCGHLMSCVMCAPAMDTCPLCRQQIRGRVRTFLS